jgi:hypothetical protein
MEGFDTHAEHPIGFTFPLVRHTSITVRDDREEWIQPPPIAGCANSKHWLRLTLQRHPETGVQVLVSSSKAICQGYDYQYFDRKNKIQVALDEPLQVPAGLLDLDTFGCPFPDIPCFRALATRKNNDEPT